VQSRQPTGQPEGSDKSPIAQQALSRFSPLDFQASANHKLSGSFGSGLAGNNLGTVPKGEQTFDGVKFDIADGLIHLGRKDPPLKEPRPDRVEGIKVSKAFAKLHILHATVGGAYKPTQYVPDGTKIAEYLVHYHDGATATIPIVYGEDVRDFNNFGTATAVTRGKLAWKGDNQYMQARGQGQSCLYLSAWDNPYPTKTVVSIDFVRVGDTPVAPFCVAMTAADPLKARASVKPLTAADLDRLWTELANSGTPAADAVEVLAGAPAQALAFLGPRIRAPGPTADVKRIAALIAKLDDDNFFERDTASKELQKLGLEALPQLRRAALETKSAEVRQRAEELLDKLRTANPTADQRRLQAVVSVLELIASNDARKLLEELAGGNAGGWLADEAQESLKRLRKN